LVQEVQVQALLRLLVEMDLILFSHHLLLLVVAEVQQDGQVVGHKVVLGVQAEEVLKDQAEQQVQVEMEHQVKEIMVVQACKHHQVLMLQEVVVDQVQ
jgi:hypothetical protein